VQKYRWLIDFAPGGSPRGRTLRPALGQNGKVAGEIEMHEEPNILKRTRICVTMLLQRSLEISFRRMVKELEGIRI
jgi:hypothetical protein